MINIADFDSEYNRFTLNFSYRSISTADLMHYTHMLILCSTSVYMYIYI